MSESLSQAKALIFRIVHRDNVPWIMANGMHCRNSAIFDTGFVPIGNPDLIARRHDRAVPCLPGGTLSDYVPFYFTPFTPMLLNIKTGFNGIRKRPIEEIVIFVSSLPTLRAQGVSFLCTDRHAYLSAARFFADLAMLDRIDWPMLQRRDFRRDPEDPGKFERYQAEALVHRQLPMNATLGVVCHNDASSAAARAAAAAHGCDIKVITKPGWYP